MNRQLNYKVEIPPLNSWNSSLGEIPPRLGTTVPTSDKNVKQVSFTKLGHLTVESFSRPATYGHGYLPD